MEKGIYQEQMIRLRNSFDGKYKENYPKEKFETIFLQLKDFPGYAFAEAVSNLICNCRAAPMLPQMRDEIYNVLERHGDKIETQDVEQEKILQLPEIPYFPDRARIDKTKEELLAEDSTLKPKIANMAADRMEKLSNNMRESADELARIKP